MNIIEVDTKSVKIPTDIQDVFKKYKKLFEKYPTLWVKGGSARETLIGNTKSMKGYIPELIESRDIDLIFLGNVTDFLNIKQIIPKWFDIERRTSEEEYFKTRDFYVNEVLLRPEVMKFTKKALRNAFEEKIHPVNNPKNWEDYQDSFSSKVCLRGILFAIREGWEIHPFLLKGLSSAGNFEILLYLKKAITVNKEEEFYNVIKDYIPYQSKDVYDLFFELLEEVPGFDVGSYLENKLQSRMTNKKKEEYFDYYHQDYEKTDQDNKLKSLSASLILLSSKNS